MAPSNLNLPVELLQLVADYIEPSAQDLCALSRTSRLYACVTPTLYADRARASRAVLWAAEAGHVATMEKTVAFMRYKEGTAGVKELMKEFNGFCYWFTPLSLAAKGNHARVAKFLLETEGVDPMLADHLYGDAPLAWAVKEGSVDVMRIS